MSRFSELSVGDLVRHKMDVKKGFVCPGVIVDIRKKEALVMWTPWQDSETGSPWLDPGVGFEPEAQIGWHRKDLLSILEDR
ncbi:MAG: hypothetical protein VXW76_06300 [Actinomycetota bacterium]|nr:hypothetical protein [Actinomycetota bacterium]